MKTLAETLRRRPFRMHPILWALYQFFRGLSWVCVHIFYKKRCIIHPENTRFDAPAIVVSNHPNTLLDPLNVGIHVRQEMFFLANYGLFKHPVSNWIFRKLYCIPVKRREDVAEGESRNNDAAFEASFEHLEKGGVLYVAAEGTSWMNRWVRPLKTGSARIALGAEARSGWQLGTKIIPVGLSYEHPNQFRSRMFIQFGNPILMKNWQSEFENDPNSAIESITKLLENQLRSLTIDTRDEQGEQFIGQLETILHNSHPLPCHADFLRSQQLTQHFLDDHTLQQKTIQYFENLQQNHLDDHLLASPPKPILGGIVVPEILMLLPGLPLFLLGYIFWWLPCYLPKFLTQKLKLYIGYDSTVKVLGGILTFSASLSGLFAFVQTITGQLSLALVAVLSAIFLGYFVETYQQIFQKTQNRWQASQFKRHHSKQWATLQNQREEILDRISKALKN